MNAMVRTTHTEIAGAVVVGAEIVAGHDGCAELALSVQHENGAVDRMVLDEDTGLEVMALCGAADLNGLIGRSWREILKGL